MRNVTVKINYNRFSFGDDLVEAVKFADIAAKTTDSDDCEVTIFIEHEKEDPS